MGELKAGIVEVDITPPIGAILRGYASRDHGAEGIHDPLCAQALVLDDGDTRIAIVGCDLIGLEEGETLAARRVAADLSDMDPKNIMLCCSHTHGGPAMSARGHRVGELATIQITTRKLGGAVAAAANRLCKARIGFGKGRVRIGMNRRECHDGRIILGQNPAGLVDTEVTVMRVDAENGMPLAVLFNYACHGTALGADNYLITADYVGYARRTAAALIPGGNGVPLFVNGAAGDINPYPRGSFTEAERCGAALGAEVAKIWAKTSTIPEVGIAADMKNVMLPIAAPPAMKELTALEQEAARRWAAVSGQGGHAPQIQVELQWAREMIRRRERRNLRKRLPCELQAFRIGDFGIVGMPAEVLVGIELNIKARSRLAFTVPAGFANGRMGYIPTARAVAEGGYETTSHLWRAEQPYAAAVETALTNGVLDLLNSLP